MTHPTDTSAGILDRVSHPAIQPGDRATWTTVRAGFVRVVVLSGNGARYGVSHDATVLVRVASKPNAFYRQGEQVSVSPLWLTLRTRLALSMAQTRMALRAEAAAALCVQAEETLSVSVPLYLTAEAFEPDALEALTGERELDATAILDYFAPLQVWLDEQNAGQSCGW